MDTVRPDDTWGLESSTLMRLALALMLAVAASASGDAQARFVNACVASAQSDNDMLIDPDQVCGCAASASMAAGTAPADLDRLIDYVQNDNLDVTSLPEPLQAAGTSAVEALMGCVVSQGMAGALAGAMSDAMSDLTTSVTSATSSAGAKDVPSGPSPAATTATPPRVLPSGLRTGNGGGTVRTRAPSPGGAIRVIG